METFGDGISAADAGFLLGKNSRELHEFFGYNTEQVGDILQQIANSGSEVVDNLKDQTSHLLDIMQSGMESVNPELVRDVILGSAGGGLGSYLTCRGACAFGGALVGGLLTEGFGALGGAELGYGAGQAICPVIGQAGAAAGGIFSGLYFNSNEASGEKGNAGKSTTKSEVKGEVHHYLSDKHHTVYTKKYKDVTDQYRLDLDGEWNKEFIEGHRGRHPNGYHKFALEELRKIHEIVNGNKEEFLELFRKRIINEVKANPGMLKKEHWLNLNKKGG